MLVAGRVQVARWKAASGSLMPTQTPLPSAVISVTWPSTSTTVARLAGRVDPGQPVPGHVGAARGGDPHPRVAGGHQPGLEAGVDASHDSARAKVDPHDGVVV